MPLMHDKNARPTNADLHRCQFGHPLNPIALAGWQEGFGSPSSQCFRQLRKCLLCRHEIPPGWVRLSCDAGCDHHVCCTPKCVARLLETARIELSNTTPIDDLALAARDDPSLLMREAALDALLELGSQAPCDPRVLLRVLNHTGQKDSRHGTSSSKVDIKTTYLAADDAVPVFEYGLWRTLRMKAARVLGRLGERDMLLNGLKASSPQVREASALGLVELAYANDVVSPAVSELGVALADEYPEVCVAAAHAVKAISCTGVDVSSLVPQLTAALEQPNVVTCKISGAPRRRWQDKETKCLYERDIIETLGVVGEAAQGAMDRIKLRVTENRSRSGSSDSLGFAASQTLLKIEAAQANTLLLQAQQVEEVPVVEEAESNDAEAQVEVAEE